VSNPDGNASRHIRFRADSYRIPSGTVQLQLRTITVPAVPTRLPPPLLPLGRLLYSALRRPPIVYYQYEGWQQLIDMNRRAPSALPLGWTLHVDGHPLSDGVDLAPGEERIARFRFGAPPSAPGARVTFNIAALGDYDAVLGGITVIVEVKP
jgi:hypothetical protein